MNSGCRESTFGPMFFNNIDDFQQDILLYFMKPDPVRRLGEGIDKKIQGRWRKFI